MTLFATPDLNVCNQGMHAIVLLSVFLRNSCAILKHVIKSILIQCKHCILLLQFPNCGLAHKFIYFWLQVLSFFNVDPARGLDDLQVESPNLVRYFPLLNFTLHFKESSHTSDFFGSVCRQCFLSTTKEILKKALLTLVSQSPLSTETH